MQQSTQMAAASLKKNSMVRKELSQSKHVNQQMISENTLKAVIGMEIKINMKIEEIIK